MPARGLIKVLGDLPPKSRKLENNNKVDHRSIGCDRALAKVMNEMGRVEAAPPKFPSLNSAAGMGKFRNNQTRCTQTIAV